jgi:hypothetical protein
LAEHVLQHVVQQTAVNMSSGITAKVATSFGVAPFLTLPTCCFSSKVRANLQQHTLEALAAQTPMGRQAEELRKTSKVSRGACMHCAVLFSKIMGSRMYFMDSWSVGRVKQALLLNVALVGRVTG